MARVAVNITVDDYEAWRESFDADTDARRAAGVSSEKVYVNADDDNDVTVVCEADDPTKMIEAVRSPEWREKMASRGVQGEPKFFIAQAA